jgi:hypothetical protein
MAQLQHSCHQVPLVNLQLLTKRIAVRPSFVLPSFNPSLFILARASLVRDEILDRLISVERLKSNANTLELLLFQAHNSHAIIKWHLMTAML